MTVKISILISFLLCFFTSIQQKLFAQDQPIKIQYINLKDSAIIQAIRNYILKVNEETKKKYYIKLTIDKFSNKRKVSANDTLIHYTASPVGLNLETFKSYKYPPFYTLIENKIIEIYPQGINETIDLNYSRKIKKKYFHLLKN